MSCPSLLHKRVQFSLIFPSFFLQESLSILRDEDEEDAEVGDILNDEEIDNILEDESDR